MTNSPTREEGDAYSRIWVVRDEMIESVHMIFKLLEKMPKGKVYKLDQQHDLGAALQEYDRKLDVFYDLAGVPRISRDMVSHLGNLSGRAIERLYQDAIESTREAQSLYGNSFCELAVKTAAMLGVTLTGVQALWNTDVISPDIETLAREYEIGARSVKSVMRKLGISDAGRMLNEIKEEKQNSNYEL